MKPAELVDRILCAACVYADDKRLLIDGEPVELAKPSLGVTHLPPSKGWTPLSFKRPPNDDTPIYAWNMKVQRPIVTSGVILNTQYDQIRSGEFRKKIEQKPELVFTGYWATHWRPAHGGPQ